MRIQLIVTPEEQERWAYFFHCEEEFRSRDIDPVQDSPELCLVNQGELKHFLSDNALPYIICQRRDSASIIDPFVFDALEDPLCLALFKNVNLRPRSLNRFEEGRYHYARIEQDRALRAEIPLTRELSESALQKIHTVPWDCKLSFLLFRESPLLREECDFDADRPRDVHAVFGTKKLNEKNTLMGWQRAQAVAKVREISGVEATAIGPDEPDIPQEEYWQTLRESKVCVSSWGFGEYCHRDVEAMLAGAVLVKPDTSFVEAVPDIYQNHKTYVPCRSDFEDVEEKIRLVLDNWGEYTEMREHARHLLVNNPLLHPSRYVDFLSTKILEVVKR